MELEEGRERRGRGEAEEEGDYICKKSGVNE
jgi:hypothetical protein